MNINATEEKETMKMNLRELVNAERRKRNCKEVSSYDDIVREERYFCALLFHYLKSANPKQMNDFLKMCGIGEDYVVSEGYTKVFVEYAMIRDLWDALGKSPESNGKKIEYLYQGVKGLKQEAPYSSDNVVAFNKQLVAGRISEKYIQSPAHWSLTKIGDLFSNTGDKGSFEDACKLKWAFNIKPDIVIELDNDTIICIEAKLESGLAQYPTKKDDVDAINTFAKNNGIKFTDNNRWGQLEIQEFAMTKILGYKKYYPVFLTAEKRSQTVPLNWIEVFNLFSKGQHPDIERVIDRLSHWKKGGENNYDNEDNCEEEESNPE